LPPRDAPKISPPPCLENGFITFGSFNNLSKINIEVIRTWSALLDAVPDSRLLLRFSKLFDIPGTIEFFRDRFVSFGVDPERLIFQGFRETRQDHLLGLLEADVILDPFPCNGGTTSFEALWMGVPFITMNCDTLMGRQGLCKLTKVGLTDLIARTSSEYVEIGRKLSLDFPRINALRSSLRQMTEDKFFQYDQHIMEMETAFSHMWSRHLAGDAHTPFDVTDGIVTEHPG
jgi:predicted O-linked N-acetylglucosamine transferase (SPINDLY family)